MTPDQAETALQVFGPSPDGARRYRDAYPDAGPDQLYELVHADWLFRMPTLYLAEAQVAGGGQVHLYELTWTAPGMGGALAPATASTYRSYSVTSPVANPPC